MYEQVNAILVVGLVTLATVAVLGVAWFLSRRKLNVRVEPVTSLAYSPAVQLRPQPVRGSPASLVRRGQDALTAGDVSGAYNYFSEAVELDPYSLDAWMGKAQTTHSEQERRICLSRARELSQH